MRIGLEDIDPQMAQALEQRLCAPIKEFLQEDIHWGGILPYRLNWKFHSGGPVVTRKREPNADERRAYELRRKRAEQADWRTAGTIMLPIVTGSTAGFALANVSPMTGVVGGVLTGAASVAAGIYWTLKASPRERLRQKVTLEEMKAVFPLLSLTRAERIYCDTLQLLVRMDTRLETENTLRETLRQVNGLLENSRQLEKRRMSLLPVLGMNSVAELETEYGELGRRFDTATDGVTRQSLQQSLAMCASRLENARAFEQGLERLKVQEEAILQTLSSAQTAIARMQIASEPQVELAAQQISETVTQMNQQTYSVEKAVEEVMTLKLP